MQDDAIYVSATYTNAGLPSRLSHIVVGPRLSCVERLGRAMRHAPHLPRPSSVNEVNIVQRNTSLTEAHSLL